jgi:hypothetical protein
MVKKATKIETQEVNAADQFATAFTVAMRVFNTQAPTADEVFAIYDYVLEDFADDEDEQKAVIDDLLACVELARKTWKTESPTTEMVTGLYERIFVEEE